jgi:glutamate synthase (NADPH/NADH) small chain
MMTEEVLYSQEPEDFYYTDVNIPCQSACPALTNIPAYIRAVFENQHDRSYAINRSANILPGVLGRICSRPCEDKCRHGEAGLGEPVNICHIKRAAADFRTGKVDPLTRPTPVEKRVLIVGAGPAGLAAAHDLACFGFEVRMMEAMDEPGGMLRYGIPEFRLPREVIQKEIQRILDLGVSLETGIRVGSDVSFEELISSYDAVLCATGCYRPLQLDVPGETLPGVYSGLNFMMDICSGKETVVGRRVRVIGAGFTAFDCARSALRLGAREVTICLRRTEQDLTVTHEEIVETKREGVRIESLMLSRRILGDDRVEGMEFVRTRPGQKRPDGKHEISPIEGSAFVLGADTVIVATGQMPGPLQIPEERNPKGGLEKGKHTFRTSKKGLYVTGDYVTGPSTVIESISMGRRAASQIAEDLTGSRFLNDTIRMQDTHITDRERIWDFLPRQAMPTLNPIEKRMSNPLSEVETGYSGALAHEEAKRCYLCYLHYEIDMDRCIYCRYCMDVAPRDCIKLVDEIRTNGDGAIIGYEETTNWHRVHAVVIDNSRCIRCGECVRVCPVDCISVTKVERIEKPI